MNTRSARKDDDVRHAMRRDIDMEEVTANEDSDIAHVVAVVNTNAEADGGGATHASIDENRPQKTNKQRSTKRKPSGTKPDNARKKPKKNKKKTTTKMAPPSPAGSVGSKVFSEEELHDHDENVTDKGEFLFTPAKVEQMDDGKFHMDLYVRIRYATPFIHERKH